MNNKNIKLYKTHQDDRDGELSHGDMNDMPYRLGYTQGYEAAISTISNGISIEEIKKHHFKLHHEWRANKPINKLLIPPIVKKP